MPPPCYHGSNSIRQIHENAFECCNCGMVFFGVDKRNPDIKRIMESFLMRRTDEVSQQLHSMNIPVTHVDLGSMPQDVTIMKSKIEDLEKTLSLFSEVLKDAIQT